MAPAERGGCSNVPAGGQCPPYMPVGADSISARELRHNPIFTYYTVFSPIIQSQKGEIPMQITRLSAAECEDLYRSALPRDFLPPS